MTEPTLERARPAIVDGHAVYVTGEDNLRVTVFNSLAGIELALEGRFVTLEGRIIPIVERIVPTAARAASISLHSLGEGFLANVMIRAAVGVPVRGEAFAIVEIVRGRLGAIQSLGCLLQGYVTGVQRLAWPGSPLEGSTTGPGLARSYTGTDPAVNVEIAETVPAGAVWRLHSFLATLVTDANVANRQVTLIIDDGANVFWQMDASAAQAASLTRSYSAYDTGGVPDFLGSTFRLPAPFPFTLVAGDRIRTSTANRQAGDNWSAPQMFVEELIAG